MTKTVCFAGFSSEMCSHKTMGHLMKECDVLSDANCQFSKQNHDMRGCDI